MHISIYGWLLILTQPWPTENKVTQLSWIIAGTVTELGNCIVAVWVMYDIWDDATVSSLHIAHYMSGPAHDCGAHHIIEWDVACGETP